MPKQIGIVDLGSNNARMVVYEYEPGAWFRLVDMIRQPVRLGEGLGATGELTGGAIARGVEALDLFADYAAASGLDRLVTIGTSALRDASNEAAFQEAVAPLGIDIEVLSGEQEAKIGVLAAANGFDLPGAWVMDLGGGSAQVSRMRQRQHTEGQAYALGGVRLTEAFFSADPPKRSEVKALESHVAETLTPVAEDLVREPVPLIAMGGTVRNLARAIQKLQEYPLSLLHGYFFRREDLEAITETLLASTTRQRARISGINSDRADVILAGALVFRWLLRAGNRDGLFISGLGVREGIFYRHFLPAPHLVDSVRQFSVRNLVARFNLDSPHTRHVRKLALQLFDGLAPLHAMGPSERQLLDAAAALHDIGIDVSFYRHHRHGAYVLASDPMSGFSHREHALLMLLIQYHHKGTPQLGPYQILAVPGDDLLLARLVLCLRLAESLERSRAHRVRDVEVILEEDRARLRLHAREQPPVEIWEAEKHRKLFQQAFGCAMTLEVQVGTELSPVPPPSAVVG